jgi:hypothetical protein
MSNFFRFIQVCIFAGILLLASHIYFIVKNVDRIMDLVNTNIQRQDNLEARVNTWGLIIHTALNDHDMIQATGYMKTEKHYGHK